MKKVLLVLVLFCSVLMGCNNILELSVESVPEENVFVLTATYGDTDTKLCLDEDGLSTTWQPGDKLYIIDLDGQKSTVEMVADITAPSKTAKFTAQTSVISGNYAVVYGCNKLNNNSIEQSLATKEELNSRMVLVAPLTVSDGQTSASIVMKQAFAMLSFTFTGLPSDISFITFGMAAAKGLQVLKGGSFSSEGWEAAFEPCITFPNKWNNFMGDYEYFPYSVGSSASVFVAPSNLSGNKAYFYLWGKQNNDIVVYEIEKDGKNLLAGVDYKINLDFSKSTRTCIKASNINGKGTCSLTSPADFRAALYCGIYSYFSLENDIDFEGAPYLPIKGTLYGNFHTLKNVNIDMERVSDVGILSEGYAEGLLVKNASVRGLSNVGGVLGKGAAYKCGFEGDVCAISSFAGGIVGASQPYYVSYDYNSLYFYNTDLCYVVGNISSNDTFLYPGTAAGGIAGASYSGGCVTNSYFIGDVSNGSGIIGYHTSNDPYCCYSYGSFAYGISYYGSSNNLYLNNLTSASNISKNVYNPNTCNCGPNKTFLSLLSAINMNEAYSTQVWKNIDAGCPLLRWQADAFGGDIVAPGFGEDTW